MNTVKLDCIANTANLVNRTLRREFAANRRTIRAAAGCRPGCGCPIRVVDGTQAPEVRGDSCHYETKGGVRIMHPSGYRRRGFSNMVYCSSTLCVEVGRDWLSERGISVACVEVL